MIDLEPIRRVLEAGPPLRLAVLFGSHAKDRATADSDVDIAILPVDPDLPAADENRLASELTKALCRDVDLVRLDRASTLLRWQVARDGMAIDAKPAAEWTRFRAIAASEHADFADSLRDAAERFRRKVAGTTS